MEEIILKVIVIILVIIIVLVFIAAGLSMLWLNIELYFLRFKLEKHPVLRAMVEEVLHDICDEEGIRVYSKSFEHMNPNIVDNGIDGALGMYIYTLDTEHQRKNNETLKTIEALELQYKRPYHDICILAGVESKVRKEDFVLPKIELCTEKLMAFGLCSYYNTYFHEIGHHFCVKERGKDHNEDDANRMAHRIIQQRLPLFFQAIPSFNFEYRLDDVELKPKDKLRAYYDYLKYYYKNRKTIVKMPKKKIISV